MGAAAASGVASGAGGGAECGDGAASGDGALAVTNAVDGDGVLVGGCCFFFKASWNCDVQAH